MHRLTGWKRWLALLFIPITFVAVSAESCSGSSGGASKAAKNEQNVQNGSFAGLVAQSPAHPVTNPVNRNSINFYVDTWNKKGTLAYTYLMNATGQIIGYYVLDGPPVSMCTALTAPYKFVNPPGDGADTLYQVPAPGLDGVYYSGAECTTYYGKDVNTGAFVEFTVGNGLQMLLFTEPLPGSKAGNAKPLGPTTVGNVKK